MEKEEGKEKLCKRGNINREEGEEIDRYGEGGRDPSELVSRSSERVQIGGGGGGEEKRRSFGAELHIQLSQVGP